MTLALNFGSTGGKEILLSLCIIKRTFLHLCYHNSPHSCQVVDFVLQHQFNHSAGLIVLLASVVQLPQGSDSPIIQGGKYPEMEIGLALVKDVRKTLPAVPHVHLKAASLLARTHT